MRHPVFQRSCDQIDSIIIGVIIAHWHLYSNNQVYQKAFWRLDVKEVLPKKYDDGLGIGQ